MQRVNEVIIPPREHQPILLLLHSYMYVGSNFSVFTSCKVFYCITCTKGLHLSAFHYT